MFEKMQTILINIEDQLKAIESSIGVIEIQKSDLSGIIRTLSERLENLADEFAEIKREIKLALQGYNFGNGYITWAQTNYGGYTYANAVEFSTMQAERLFIKL